MQITIQYQKTQQFKLKGYERPTPVRLANEALRAGRTSNIEFWIRYSTKFINWRSDPPASPERDNKRTKKIEYVSRWRAGAISLFDVYPPSAAPEATRVQRSMFDVQKTLYSAVQYSRRNGQTF